MKNLLILGVIDWYKWKVRISGVNREYFSNVFTGDPHQIIWNMGHMPVNWRFLNDYDIFVRDVEVWTFIKFTKSNKLPKNY